MADQNIHVNIQFDADNTRAKRSINELSATLNQISQTEITIPHGSIDQAVKSANQLQTALSQAVNVDTGRLDFAKLQSSLKAANTDLITVSANLLTLGPKGQQAFNQLANSITLAQAPARRLNSTLIEFGNTLIRTIRWQVASTLIHGFVGTVKEAVGYIEDLNKSLVRIQAVTQKNSAEMNSFANQARGLANELKVATKDYMDASLIFFQQGLDTSEVIERTNATMKLAKLTGEAVSQVSSELTAIWNNFDDGTQSLEYYVDVVTALGAATASSSQEIATGLQKFAAVADAVGLSYEKATAALATVTAKTRQSAEIIGTSFKTIFARIQGLSLGETLDDGVTLNKYSEALKKVGVDILDQQGELKAMDDILDDLGDKWNKISQAQKVALAETVAGTRQYTQFMALMENYDEILSNQNVAENAEGTLEKQYSIYKDSIEAITQEYENSKKKIFDQLVNEDTIKSVKKFLTEIMDTVSKLIKNMGGVKGLIMFVMLKLTSTFMPQIQTGLSNIISNFKDYWGITDKQQTNTLINLKKMVEASREFNNTKNSALNNASNNTSSTEGTTKGVTSSKNPQTEYELKQNEIINQKLQERNELEDLIYKKRIELTKNGRFMFETEKARALEEIDELERNKEQLDIQLQIVANAKEQRAIEQDLVSSTMRRMEILRNPLPEIQGKNRTDDINQNQRLTDSLNSFSASSETEKNENQAQHINDLDETRNIMTARVNEKTDRILAIDAEKEKLEELNQTNNDLSEAQKADNQKRIEELDDERKAIEQVKDKYEEYRALLNTSTKELKAKGQNKNDIAKEALAYDKKTTLDKDQAEYDQSFAARQQAMNNVKNVGDSTHVVDSTQAQASQTAVQQTFAQTPNPELGKQAQELFQAAVQNMNDYEKGLQSSEQNLQTLNESYGEINGYVEGIKNITADTDALIKRQSASEKGLTLSRGQQKKYTEQTNIAATTLGKNLTNLLKSNTKIGTAMKEQLQTSLKNVKIIDKSTNQYKDIQTNINRINNALKDGKGFENLSAEDLEILKEALQDMGDVGKTAMNGLSEASSGMKRDLQAAGEGTEEYDQHLDNIVNDSRNAGQATENLRQNYQRLKGETETGPQVNMLNTFTQGLQKVTQTASQVQMGISMLTTGTEQLSEAFGENGTTMQKVTAIMMLLQGAVSIFNAVQALSTIITKLAAKGVANLTKKLAANTGAKWANTAATVAQKIAENGWAGIALGVALVATIGLTAAIIASTAKKQADTKAAEENTKALNDSAEASKKNADAKKEEYEAALKLYKTYKNLYDEYLNTGKKTEDLESKTADLIKQFDIEHGILLLLTGQYKLLNDEIERRMKLSGDQAVATAQSAVSDSITAFMNGDSILGEGQGGGLAKYYSATEGKFGVSWLIPDEVRSYWNNFIETDSWKTTKGKWEYDEPNKELWLRPGNLDDMGNFDAIIQAFRFFISNLGGIDANTKTSLDEAISLGLNKYNDNQQEAVGNIGTAHANQVNTTIDVEKHKEGLYGDLSLKDYLTRRQTVAGNLSSQGISEEDIKKNFSADTDLTGLERNSQAIFEFLNTPGMDGMSLDTLIQYVTAAGMTMEEFVTNFLGDYASGLDITKSNLEEWLTAYKPNIQNARLNTVITTQTALLKDWDLLDEDEIGKRIDEYATELFDTYYGLVDETGQHVTREMFDKMLPAEQKALIENWESRSRKTWAGSTYRAESNNWIAPLSREDYENTVEAGTIREMRESGRQEEQEADAGVQAARGDKSTYNATWAYVKDGQLVQLGPGVDGNLKVEQSGQLAGNYDGLNPLIDVAQNNNKWSEDETEFVREMIYRVASGEHINTDEWARLEALPKAIDTMKEAIDSLTYDVYDGEHEPTHQYWWDVWEQKNTDYNEYLSSHGATSDNIESILDNNLSTAIDAFNTVYDKETSKIIDDRYKDYQNEYRTQAEVEQEAYENYLSNTSARQIESAKALGLADGEWSAELERLEKLIPQGSRTNAEYAVTLQGIALANKRLETGVKTLDDNWETWNEHMQNSSQYSYELSKELPEINKAVQQILNLENDEFSLLPDDFVQKHWNKIQAVLEGTEGAVDDLRNIAGQEILLNINGTIDADGNLKADIENLHNYIASMDEKQFKVGVALDAENEAEFFNACQQIIDTAEMTAEQAQAYFSSMGYDIKFKEGTAVTTATYTYPNVEVDPENPGHFIKGNPDTFEISTTTTMPGTAIETITPNGSYGGGIGVLTTTPKSFAPNIQKAKESKNTSKEKKDKKLSEKETERYHEITALIKNYSKELEKAGKAKDKAFGPAKVKAMQAEIAAQAQLNAGTEEYIREIEEWLAIDKQRIQAQGATFDEYGNISNYTELMQQHIDTYNAAVAAYNASNQDEADKKRFENAEKAYSDFMAQLKQYEDTNNLLQEQQETLLDGLQQIYDLTTQKNQYIIEFKIQADDDAIAFIDYLKNKLDNFTDGVNDAAEKLAYLNDEAARLMSKNSTYNEAIDMTLQHYLGDQKGWDQSAIDAYIERFKNNALTEADMSALEDMSENEFNYLREMRDNLLEINNLMMENMNQVIETVQESFTKTAEDLDKATRPIERAASALENYAAIIDIVGRDALGITDAIAAELDNAAVAVAHSATVAAKAKVDTLQSERDEVQRLYDEAMDQHLFEMAYKWQTVLEEMDDEIAAATDDFNSKWQEELTKAREAFENTVERIKQSMLDAFAGSIGSWSALKDSLEYAKTAADRFVPQYKEIYELSKLNRDIMKSIDNTSNIKNKQALRDLQKEINELEQHSGEISQYDLDNARRRYELELARLQLEEARDAKSTVRLSKDSEGNWSYVYTANQDEVEKAEQNYEDKLYAMQQANNEYINSLSDQILELEEQYAEKLAEIRLDNTMSEEERNAAIERLNAYFAEQMEYLTNEGQKAVDNNSRLFEEEWTTYHNWTDAFGNDTQARIDNQHDFMTQFGDTILGQYTGFGNFDELNSKMVEIAQQASADMEVVYGELTNQIAAAMEATGYNVETFGQTVSDTVHNEIVPSAQKAEQAVVDMAEAAANEFATLVSSVSEWQTTYATEMKKIIKKNEKLAESVNSVAEAYATLVAQMYAAANAPAPKTLKFNHSILDLYTDTDTEGTGGSDGDDDDSEDFGGSGTHKTYWTYINDDVCMRHRWDNTKKEWINSAGAHDLVNSTDPNYYYWCNHCNHGIRYNRGGCFDPNTPILMANGQYKILSDVKRNDYIIAYDEETNTYLPARVENNFVNHTTQFVYRLVFDNGTELLLTAGHPLLSTKGWVSLSPTLAQQEHNIATQLLQLGDTLISLNGNYSVIKIIEIRKPQYDVYNLSVEKYHTFIVNNFIAHNMSAIAVSMKYDTGGYTGDWNSSQGKLAILHEKELVLNKDDTKNILGTVEMVRKLSSKIDLNAQTARYAFNYHPIISEPRPIDKELQVDQTVTISAEFPNVQNRTEIEEAFTTLINQASQYANRKS